MFALSNQNEMEKKLIERNLPFNQQYIYLGIERGSILDGQFCTCDNCGKIITNMVRVVNKETKQRFTIGTDCAETLAKAKSLFNNGYATDYYNDLYAYNLAARFVTELKAGCEIIESNILDSVLINRKGKQQRCYTKDLQKYFPDVLQTHA